MTLRWLNRSPDFFDTFGLPEIKGEEDVDMVEHFREAAPAVFMPSEEPTMVYVEEAPAPEGINTNEEGILEFLAGMEGHQAAIRTHEGDAGDVNTLCADLAKSPFRVLDEFYHNGRDGLGIWGLGLRKSHTQSQLLSLAVNEERLTRANVEQHLEPRRRAPNARYKKIAFRAGDLRNIYDDDQEVAKAKEDKQEWTSSRIPKVL